jgi:hypothetical protein
MKYEIERTINKCFLKQNEDKLIGELEYNFASMKIKGSIDNLGKFEVKTKGILFWFRLLINYEDRTVNFSI